MKKLAIFTAILFLQFSLPKQSYASIFDFLNLTKKETNVQSIEIKNPNEEFLTTLENKKIQNVKTAQNAKQKQRISNEKILHNQELFKQRTIASFRLNLRNIYDERLPKNIQNELSQENGISKKAAVNFNFNANNYLNLYFASDIGDINYNENSPQYNNRIDFNRNVNDLKFGLKYNF